MDFLFGGMLTFCQIIIRGGPYKETVPKKMLKCVHSHCSHIKYIVIKRLKKYTTSGSTKMHASCTSILSKLCKFFQHTQGNVKMDEITTLTTL